MPTQHDIRFTADNIQLTGTLHLPDTPQPPFIIGCHGLLANRNSPKQISLAEALNHHGIAYLRFDHRGCGDSQGRFDTENLLENRCSDLYHAISTMQSQSNMGPFAGLFGSSFGGTVVLATASQREVPRLATYAAPISSRSINKPSISDIQSNIQLSPNSPETYSFDISSNLSTISNTLIMHGSKDEIVPVKQAQQIYQIIQNPKKLIIHENGDHRMTNPTHQKDFLTQCTQWFLS